MFFSIFSSGGHFIQLSGTIIAVLVKDDKRNTSVKLLNTSAESLLKVFLFLALAAILFSQVEPF